MSVIIKGLNKFHSCRLCPFNNSDCYCNITKGIIDRDDYSCESECPIVQLPKKHVDLIDRNEIEYMKAIHDMKWGKITASECATKIKYSAPTIIEADGGDAE